MQELRGRLSTHLLCPNVTATNVVRTRVDIHPCTTRLGLFCGLRCRTDSSSLDLPHRTCFSVSGMALLTDHLRL